VTRLLAFVALASVLAACGSSPGGTDVATGIRGVVLAGPQCPVEQPGSPCPDLPLPDVEVRASRDGSVAGTARTDEQGRFRIALEPGRYTVEAVVSAGGVPPTSRPVEVTVPASGFAEVTVPVDTGIR
jgi:hypothetical protein